MPNIGPLEIIIVLVIVLLIFGPKLLPDLGRSLGRGMREFEDRLSLVDHLDELRTRIIIALAAFGVALALCFWQNHLLLRIANHPLGHHRHPTTLGVAEPFTTTLTIAAYAAILISMPILL